ncbi:unnamed protein product, partial [Mesorhabditis spiculigera]
MFSEEEHELRVLINSFNMCLMTSNFSIEYLLGIGTAQHQDDQNDRIDLQLEGGDLWEQFHNLGTEMIVTKMGRRMFPTIQITAYGLEADAQYSFLVDLESIDSKRYRYSFHQSRWIATGPGEPELPSRVFVHPDSPAPGCHWMGGPISFDKIKLTNNQMDKRGHIIVNSMHKYRPRIQVIKHGAEEKRALFSFEETTFVAVTAYQNHRITSLKIERNPFAKGFRDGDVDELKQINIFTPLLTLIKNFEP